MGSGPDVPVSRRGQAAMEYMAVVGLALLITTPLILDVQQSTQELRNAFQNSLARDALNNIEEAARLVNSQGEPAKVTFRIRMPTNINRTNVSGNHLYIARDSGDHLSEFFSVLEFNVTGTIPNRSGIHQMTAEAEEDVVNITVR